MKIDRVEIRSELECNGGVHQATIARNELFKAVTEENLDGKHGLQIDLDREATAWSSVQNERVLRVVFKDATIQEFRIIKPTDGRVVRGALTARVKAQSILMDLQNGLVTRTEGDGTESVFYTLLSRTRQELVDLIVAKAPSYFAVGTIDDASTVVKTFTFEFDSPLRALQELAVLEEMELNVRRNGATDYKVDLLDAIGSSATQPEFRYRKNLKGLSRELDSGKLVTRVYPAGGGDDAVRLSIGEAMWEVTAVPTGTTADLAGSPIYEDDVLNGKFLEDDAGATYEITDSDATLQRVTTAIDHGLSVGDRVLFRANVDGDQLVYVESLVAQATYGVKVDVVEHTDLVFINNLAPNPTFRNWSGGDPDDWTDVGTPTVTEEIDAQYTKVGGSSVKVVADAEGEGIACSAITIAPFDPDIYYSGFVDVFVASGEVEFFWEHSTEGRFPLEGADKSAFTNEHDRFIHLAIEGKEYPSGTVVLKVVARNGAATFYVDDAQFSNDATNLPFYDGNAPAELWQRGLQALTDRDAPVVSYRIDVIDVESADPSNFPYDAVTLGGTVLVEDEVLSLQLQTRAVSVTRDILAAKTLKLQLSNRHVDLIDVLTQRRRRVRQTQPLRGSIATIENFTASLMGDGEVVIKVWGSGGTRSFRYIADTSTMPTVGEVIDTGGDGTTSNLVDGTEVAIASFRNVQRTELVRNERLYIRIVAYPILNAGGVPGATDTAITDVSGFWNAEIKSSSVVQDGDATTGEASVCRKFITDGRAAAIRVYRRKDAWPTKNGTQTGDPDPSYDRGTIGQNDNWSIIDGGWSGGDVVHDVAITVDFNGLGGEREEYQYTVLNTGGGGNPQITNAWNVKIQNGTACSPTSNRNKEEPHWTLLDAIDTIHEIRVYRIINGDPLSEELVKTETSPVTNDSYIDTCPRYGYGVPPGGTLIFIEYRLELWVTIGPVFKDSVVVYTSGDQNKWNDCGAGA